jgi:hypothetical protein
VTTTTVCTLSSDPTFGQTDGCVTIALASNNPRLWRELDRTSAPLKDVIEQAG